MSKAGIIGNGFVGSAIVAGMTEFVDQVFIYDVDPNKSNNSLEETVNESDVIFVSVPTPMENVLGGKIDLSIIEAALKSVSDAKTSDRHPVLAVKSTVVPGTMEGLQEKFKN